MSVPVKRRTRHGDGASRYGVQSTYEQDGSQRFRNTNTPPHPFARIGRHGAGAPCSREGWGWGPNPGLRTRTITLSPGGNREPRHRRRPHRRSGDHRGCRSPTRSADAPRRRIVILEKALNVGEGQHRGVVRHPPPALHPPGGDHGGRDGLQLTATGAVHRGFRNRASGSTTPTCCG